MSLDTKLESINQISNTKEKIKAFQDTILPYFGITKKCAPDAKAIETFIEFVVQNIGETEGQTSKPLLLFVSKTMEDIEEDYNEQLLKICETFIDLVRPKYSYYCDSLINVIRLISELHQADEEFRNAGKAMASIDTEDQYVQQVLSIYDRCEWRIQTAEYFLADEDNTSATTHIQKSRKLLREIKLNNPNRYKLELRHKTCYSRILDSERKFLAASVNYLELSQMSNKIVADDDLIQSLNNAVTCAILAPAGGSRSRVLQMLYRDERTKTLPNYKVLEKMNKNMILTNKEQNNFSTTLSDHHQARLSGGLTVFEKAIYEHNMLSASALYKNIKIEQLSKLLGVNDTQSEDLARIMIQEGRMNATIDQVDGIIQFDDDNSILLNWDAQIQDLCYQINDICDLIDLTYPGKFNVI